VNIQTINSTEPLPDEGQLEPTEQRPFLFIVLHGDQPTLGGARHDLSQVDVITIGRGKERDALRSEHGGSRQLTLQFPSPTVSKAHARLVRCSDGWMLEDLGSKNGSCVNGRRVTRGLVQDGDYVEFGSVFSRYRAAMDIPTEPALDVDSRSFDTNPFGFSSLVPTLASQLDALARVARLPFTTLLLGETGTGKEVVAHGMHELSGTSGPFVAVNCGALPTSLIESHLFGHVKGSFTGAQRDEPGFIRSAEGGTLFLDEVGDLPLPAQATLLRVLEQREVIPVGSAKPTVVDVRFIAATNKSLDELCLRGLFRADLFARLAAYKHRLPLLCDRLEDFGMLMREMSRRAGPLHGASLRLSVQAARSLFSYHWPNNIRELESVLGVAIALGEAGSVQRLNLPRTTTAPVCDEQPHNPDELRERLISVMREHQGNMTHVARHMGKSRTQIYRWVQEFGIDPKEYRA